MSPKYTVNTIGTYCIHLKIDQAIFLGKFHVVFDYFPINESGILGLSFLQENKAVIDLNKVVLIIPEKIEEVCIQLFIKPAWSNCVLLINTDGFINYEYISNY